MVFPQGLLPAAYHCQVLSFLRIVWHEGFVGENRLRDWITRYEHHPVSFVLVEHGLVISHAQVVWKRLAHGGRMYKAYGLTGVLTYPSFRGQGYGEQVVRAATEYIDRCDGDAALFHCDPALKGFYGRCGWEHIAGVATYAGVWEKYEVTSEILMMRFYTAEAREAFRQGPLYWDEDSTW